jgi:hypothetical protein
MKYAAFLLTVTLLVAWMIDPMAAAAQDSPPVLPGAPDQVPAGDLIALAATALAVAALGLRRRN